MMSKWNDHFTNIGRFDMLRFIEFHLISFMDWCLMFFYGIRFIGRTVFVLRRRTGSIFCYSRRFLTSFYYGKALRFPIFILELGVIVGIEVSPYLTFEQHSFRIISSEVERLRNKDVLLVKVQLISNLEDSSWESREFNERTRSDLLFRAPCGELLI